ncbi:MAG: hypothetical protein NTY50_19760 [Methylobacter sp.]|nr:hypothetical protein [Methylobacter sp.]
MDYLNKTNESTASQQPLENSSGESMGINRREGESMGINRREVLARLGKGIVYTAPATLALLSLEAKATSAFG